MLCTRRKLGPTWPNSAAKQCLDTIHPLPTRNCTRTATPTVARPVSRSGVANELQNHRTLLAMISNVVGKEATLLGKGPGGPVDTTSSLPSRLRSTARSVSDSTACGADAAHYSAWTKACLVQPSAWSASWCSGKLCAVCKRWSVPRDDCYGHLDVQAELSK